MTEYDKTFAFKAGELLAAAVALAFITYIGLAVQDIDPDVGFALCSVVLLCGTFAPAAFWWARYEVEAEDMLSLAVRISKACVAIAGLVTVAGAFGMC